METQTVNTNTGEMDIQKISARQLRDILFHLPNKKISVWQLWSELCGVENPDEEVQVDHTMFFSLGI